MIKDYTLKKINFRFIKFSNLIKFMYNVFMKNKQFVKRLTLLYIKDNSHQYDDWLSDTFGSLILSYNCKQALDKFNKNYIDIVLIEMENDFDEKVAFIQALREKRQLISIVVLTKDKKCKTLKKFIEISVDGYLNHPMDSLKTIEIFNSLESKYQLAEEYEANKQNLNLLTQYQQVSDNNAIISKTDPSGKITYVNDNFCKISGYTKNELLGNNHNMIRHPDSKKAIFKEMWETVKYKKEQWKGIIRNNSKTGESYYVKSTIAPIKDEDGNIIEYIGLRDNISSMMSDKKHFLDKIESNHLSLLILVQIEEFDMIEKFYNLTTIDKIEKMFGFKLLSYLPHEYKFDNVYNLDNGRYALLTNLQDFIVTQIEIDGYLKKFIENVNKSILEIDGIEYDINVSLSYAFGKHMLYEDAKAGLDEAIAKNMIICHSNDFSIKHQQEAKKNLEVIKMVKIALDNYNIVSYFQPIINNKTQEIEKYESLVRLIDENGKVLSPYEFLNISKKGTYYNKITQRVLENSFKMLKSVTTQLSINLSTLDIEKEETRYLIFELLEEYKNDRNRLVFELLEDENVKDVQTIKEFIQKVKSMDVCIAIDDFGAGYSNFERLLEFEPDIIKIDGSLIKNIIEDKYSKNVVETIVTFAKKQQIKIIAEYVETKEIFDYLNDLGVDYSQGYYFGKPEELKLQ